MGASLPTSICVWLAGGAAHTQKPCHRAPRTARRARPLPLRRLQLREHLARVRELVIHLPLVPQLLAVDGDDEVTLAARFELDLGVGEGLPDLGAQTGRPRQVVSNHAVLDAHVHGAKGRPRPRRGQRMRASAQASRRRRCAAALRRQLPAFGFVRNPPVRAAGRAAGCRVRPARGGR